jgi:16S rRNA (guanine527-N7)-methyltransferase
VFHVERDIIQEWLSAKKIELSKSTTDKMLVFAELIHSANQKFNLTGLKTKDEIITELILKSIEPVCDIIVPRGTCFADIGSGAGIPGIVLALYFNNFSGVLIESNQKKAGFIKSIIDEFKLQDIEVICSRAEEIAESAAHREHYNWCFARAFGKLYITLELCAPFVKSKGNLYIYSTLLPGNIPEETLKHTEKLGLMIMSHKEISGIKLSDSGLCFKKEKHTPDKYPRMFAIIKREAEKTV